MAKTKPPQFDLVSDRKKIQTSENVTSVEVHYRTVGCKTTVKTEVNKTTNNQYNTGILNKLFIHR